jgi:hypothetical protein
MGRRLRGRSLRREGDDRQARGRFSRRRLVASARRAICSLGGEIAAIDFKIGDVLRAGVAARDGAVNRVGVSVCFLRASLPRVILEKLGKALGLGDVL